MSVGDSFQLDGDLRGLRFPGDGDVVTIEVEVRRFHGLFDPGSTHVYGMSGNPVDVGRWVRVTVEDMGPGSPNPEGME